MSITEERAAALQEILADWKQADPAQVWDAFDFEDFNEMVGDLADLLAEVERLHIRATLADAMIERVARDTAAKEAFTRQRQWEDLPDDERTYLREHAHRVLAADLIPKKNAGPVDPTTEYQEEA